MDRAELAQLLYNAVEKVGTEDVNGIQRAYVTQTDDGFEVSGNSRADVSSLYGIEPAMLAEMDNPFPLIAPREGPPQFDARGSFNRGLLRQALSRIVDEV